MVVEEFEESRGSVTELSATLTMAVDVVVVIDVPSSLDSSSLGTSPSKGRIIHVPII